ncbi:regulatory protein RecX [Patescibacteria group bacterium]
MSLRPRSEHELEAYIHKKLISYRVKEKEEMYARVYTRLKELGYLDDISFANWWIEQRSKRNAKGLSVIKRELMQKGVDRSLIDDIFSQLDGDVHEREFEKAEQLIHKKLQYWKKFTDIKGKQKLYGYYMRRGFSTDIIRSLVDKYW